MSCYPSSVGGVEEHVCFGTISSSKEKGPTAIWTHLSPILDLVKASSPNGTVEKLRELGIDDPYLFPPGIFTDMLKCKQDEKEIFLKRLSKSGTKSARLSLEAGFNDSFIPRTLQLNLPKPLSELYDPVCLGLSYPDLLLECEAAFQVLNIDENQASSVEEETRKQAKSKLWFQMRAGRVTVSRFKAAARTDPANPSKSLIKQICYPQAYKFTSAATEITNDTVIMNGTQEKRWGCQHENEARNVYKAHVAMQHRDFMVEDSGLIISPDYPHLGASPDGKIKCSCCGMGILEIKCPYCKCGDTHEQAAEDKDFCLQNMGGQISLKRNHTYFYQVQAQLNISSSEYCDFVVLTQDNTLFIERIVKDADFFQQALENVTSFFKLGVLPELLAKWYTRSTDLPAPTPGPSNATKHVYYCQEPEQGTMLKCQSGYCNVEVFHLKCLGLKGLPK
ncbi:uncharacterized protein LOC132864548 [Neoarius graeffei]|uniref:uncharacterized protein LOC132864548 n=1 Tax=Neoarius graeffei TaxID=443677 RepID=UPI00298C9906|nr:uncharacterized protein LOC132864548 [Neoarius graeffei]